MTQAEARETAIDMMTNAFLDDDGNVRDVSNAVVEFIEGAAAAPHVFVLRAWIDQAERDESPETPNFELTGSKGERHEPDLSEVDEREATEQLALAMTRAVMDRAGVSETIAAQAVAYGLKEHFPEPGAPDDPDSLKAWSDAMEATMDRRARELAAGAP
jgi:hypothetical protein